jgi:RyR domain
MHYKPSPIDISQVTLPPDIAALTERLAENSHDIWAQQRMQDGWTHGAKRDDAQKKHPCLVPYDDLPDTEKVYDRRLAMETLRSILALGYSIEKAAGR